MWGAVGLIRDDRKEGETPSGKYQRSIADLGTSAATIRISVYGTVDCLVVKAEFTTLPTTFEQENVRGFKEI